MNFSIYSGHEVLENTISSEDINFTLNSLKNDAKKRRELYEQIRVNEEYIVIHHSNESGVDIQQLLMQIQIAWEKINSIFEARNSDDYVVREKIEARDRLLSSVKYGKEDTHDRELEARKRIKEREVDIMIERAKLFASNNNLKNLESSEDFPYPSLGIPGGDIFDIKSVADGARDVAILGAFLRPDANDLIEKYNLSRMMTGSGAEVVTIVYSGNGLKKAQELANILDSHNDSSEDPQKIYDFHMGIATLVGINKPSAAKWSLERAQSVDPKFVSE